VLFGGGNEIALAPFFTWFWFNVFIIIVVKNNIKNFLFFFFKKPF
jgi:hypothetical protein